MLQISQLGKQILALEPNFRVSETYGLADMTACMVPDIWERRSLLHNCTSQPQLLRSCSRRMCLWLLITLLLLGIYNKYSNLERGLLVKCFETSCVTLESCIRLLEQYIIISTLKGVSLCYARRGISNVRIRLGLRIIYWVLRKCCK